jgi:hypothetical protein
MALSDPQDIIISGSTISLPLISRLATEALYGSADGLVKYRISHQNGAKNTRHLINLDHAKIAADPLLAGVNVKAKFKVYTVIESPATGYTVAEQKAVVDGYLAELTAGSGALIARVLGGES